MFLKKTKRWKSKVIIILNYKIMKNKSSERTNYHFDFIAYLQITIYLWRII